MSHSKPLKVSRRPPKPRWAIGSSYLIEVTLTVCSDSYLFVGSGYPKLVGLPEEEFDKVLRLPPHSRELQATMERHMYDDFFRLEKGGRAVIPASSIKGMLRTRMEHMLPGQACFIWWGGGRGSWRYREIYHPKHRNKDPKEGNYCVVCDLLGGRGLASRVSVTNAVSDEPFDEKPITLRFNRGLRRIVAVCPNSKFTFSIYCKNMGEAEVGLILRALNIHNGRPVLLGAYKYKRVRVEGEGMKVFGHVTLSLKRVIRYKVEGGVAVEEELDPERFTREVCEAAMERYKPKELDEASKVPLMRRWG